MSLQSDECDGVTMRCENGGNGDWYITLYHPEKGMTAIRFCTSGGKIPLAVLLKVAELGRLMDKLQLNGTEIVRTNKYTGFDDVKNNFNDKYK